MGGFVHSSAETAAWVQSGTSGTLTVHDGTQTASLTLIGTYATSDFSVADAYLYNMLRWAHHTGIDLDKWPVLPAFFARVDARPAVQAALAAEKSHQGA